MSRLIDGKLDKSRQTKTGEWRRRRIVAGTDEQTELQLEKRTERERERDGGTVAVKSAGMDSLIEVQVNYRHSCPRSHLFHRIASNPGHTVYLHT